MTDVIETHHVVVARRRWEVVLVRAWPAVVLLVLAALGVATVAWGISNRAIFAELVLRPDEVAGRAAQLAGRRRLFYYAIGAVALSVPIAARSVWRFRAGHAPRVYAGLLALLAMSPALLALTLPAFEFEHAFYAGCVVLAAGMAVARIAKDLRLERLTAGRDLSARAARGAVLFGCIAFTGSIGFLAHWRHVTFRSQLYDLSWEVNALWGIVHRGVPVVSSAAHDYYPNAHLPAVYLGLHTPFIYYLYAPFYAIFDDPRAALWLQAAHMSVGAIGVYLAAHAWLKRRWLGVLFAYVYLLNPAVQGYCLHDLHANVLAVPMVLLAVGTMASGRVRLAVACAILAALCREETPIYAACIALFWIFSRPDRRRMIAGASVLAFCVVWFAFVTAWLMPHFGGQARWSYYAFYFDQAASALSVVKSLVLDPLGGITIAARPRYLEFLWLSLLPLGFLALQGRHAAWFLIAPALLILPSWNSAFTIPGMNYSAPITPAVILMSVYGARAWLMQDRRDRRFLEGRRVVLASYVAAVGLLSNFLYGNIASKTFKLEYGAFSNQRESAYRYQSFVGYDPSLPAYGRLERAVWEAFDHIPRNAAVSASWGINPQLSSRARIYMYPFLGPVSHPDEQATVVILDKLAPLNRSTGQYIKELRESTVWHQTFENEGAVIFERVKKTM